MDGTNGIVIIGKFPQSANRHFRRERYKSLIRRAKRANDGTAFILPSRPPAQTPTRVSILQDAVLYA
jgi:hypothetical protein